MHLHMIQMAVYMKMLSGREHRVFPDFTKQSVRSWWGDKTKILLEHGISGIWNDMNEPASFNGPLPDDVQFEYGAHEKVHNIYGHFYGKSHI